MSIALAVILMFPPVLWAAMNGTMEKGLLEEKKKAYGEYRKAREEMKELLTVKANVDCILNMEEK